MRTRAIGATRELLREEVCGEHRDIRPPFAERRQLDRHDLQSVVQVLAKRALLDGALEILVGGGDDPDVDPDRPLSADRPHLAILKNAQELHLQRRTHLGDLVEEHRALVGELQQTGARRRRARESAPLVSEELGLEKVARNGTAIDRQKGLGRPRGERVQRPGRELFPGAALPHDEHRGVGRGELRDQRLDLLDQDVLADQEGKPAGGPLR